jgi:hypothetical protein
LRATRDPLFPLPNPPISPVTSRSSGRVGPRLTRLPPKKGAGGGEVGSRNAEGQRSHTDSASLARPRLGSRGVPPTEYLYVNPPCPSVFTSYSKVQFRRDPCTQRGVVLTSGFARVPCGPRRGAEDRSRGRIYSWRRTLTRPARRHGSSRCRPGA